MPKPVKCDFGPPPANPGCASKILPPLLVRIIDKAKDYSEYFWYPKCFGLCPREMVQKLVFRQTARKMCYDIPSSTSLSKCPIARREEK